MFWTTHFYFYLLKYFNSHIFIVKCLFDTSYLIYRSKGDEICFQANFTSATSTASPTIVRIWETSCIVLFSLQWVLLYFVIFHIVTRILTWFNLKHRTYKNQPFLIHLLSNVWRAQFAICLFILPKITAVIGKLRMPILIKSIEYTVHSTNIEVG